jgi:hypothetical protein
MTQEHREKLIAVMTELSTSAHLGANYTDPEAAYFLLGDIRGTCLRAAMAIGAVINHDIKLIPFTNDEMELAREIMSTNNEIKKELGRK